jgi:hypothetical protein
MTINYNLDFFNVKNNLVIGHGWLFDEENKIHSLWLVKKSKIKDSCDRIKIKYGNFREDVFLFHKKSIKSANSGFVMSGSFDNSIDASDKFILEVHYANEQLKTKEITLSTRFKSSLMHYLLHLFLRARKSSFKAAFSKFKGYQKEYSKFKLEKMYSKNKSPNLETILIIDHSMGGGTNIYSNRVIRENYKNNNQLSLSYNLNNFHFCVNLNNQNFYNFENFSDLEIYLRQFNIHKIFLNNLVSFEKPSEILQLILNIKNYNKAHLTFFLHDFYAVCPSYQLLDKNLKFCEIPDISKCQKCISENENVYPFINRIPDLAEWRSLWGSFLRQTSEVILFSEYSKNLLLKAYPNINLNKKIFLSPPTFSIINLPNKIKIKYKKKIVIGVLGSILRHKGSLVLERLVETIKKRNIDINIKVIGSVDRYLDPNIVDVSGMYDPNNLSSLIQESGANIFFFPSICPETYSYVISELISHNLPIAIFNLGAPIERLRNYKKSIILKSDNPNLVLNNLISFHNNIYS